MSGFEVAGIVLAVLPLAVKAVKSYSEGLEESRKLLSTKAHDEIKRDLLDELYRELVLFNRHMRKVLQALPNVSEQRCSQVLSNLNQQDWQSNSDVVQALRSYLGNDFDEFDHALSQVYHWMDGILADQNLQSQGVSKGTKTFRENLKRFTDASAAKATESKFKDRLYLWRKEGRLKREVKNFRQWRKFVEKITENNQYRSGTISPEIRRQLTRPTCVLPRLSHGLYRALSESWRCVPNCIGDHKARICLQSEAKLHQKADGDSLKYRILFLVPLTDPNSANPQWLETTITVRCLPRRSVVGFNQVGVDVEQVESICSTILKHPWRRGHKLRFTVNHFEQEAKSEIHCARNYLQSAFEFEPTTKEILLTDALADLGHQLDLTQKRKLALELAYGMMTFSGSPWLKERWGKDHISFFHTNTNKICHTQPLVSTDMKPFSDRSTQIPLNIIHPLPPVLSLGIVLLELETGKSIESMRSDDDYVDPTNQIADENTDFTAANREAEKQSMLTPKYKEAVLACLDEREWDDGQGEEPNVLQERVRQRIYEQIIVKLESDLQDPMT